jgi:hypothetical protein
MQNHNAKSRKQRTVERREEERGNVEEERKWGRREEWNEINQFPKGRK